ncbi:MAG: hypothetical protein M1571_10530 [Firmicutes bacterium]|nr:hypothetical protein [Bacillota bacterium]
MSKMPVWQMVKQAVSAIGDKATSNAEIKKYIHNHFGDVNGGTINADIIACCVNRQSRVNWPQNQKPRIANGKYDFLFCVGRGLVSLYDPEKHGVWEISFHNGKLSVRRADGEQLPEIVPVQLKATLTKKKQIVRPDIKRPSPQEVRHYLEKWNSLEGYREQEIALNKLFWEFCPNNTALDNILIKVATLNTFYSTNIFSVFNVARHILSLDLDERLKQGDTTLVAAIATGHGVKKIKTGKETYFYSFATKYCSHHYPDLFPIYDSFIAELLIYLRDTDRFSDFTREGLRDFAVFKETIYKLRDFYALQSFSLKDLDKYLWQLGKESFLNIYGYKGKND